MEVMGQVIVGHMVTAHPMNTPPFLNHDPQPEGLAVRVIQIHPVHGTATVELQAQGATAAVLIMHAESFAHMATCSAKCRLPCAWVHLTVLPFS